MSGISRRRFMTLGVAGAASVAGGSLVRAASFEEIDGFVGVRVDDVIESERGDYGVIILKDDNDRYLPIWVALFQAEAVRLGVEGVKPPRPMTYEFAQSLLEAAGGEPRYITITQLREMTYFAQFVFEVDGDLRSVDSRPSDALALAVRVDIPIFVSPEVLDRAAVAEDELGEIEPVNRA